MIIDFRTDPSRYKHRKLEFASPTLTVPALIGDRSEDHNENYLHSGLKQKNHPAFLNSRADRPGFRSNEQDQNTCIHSSITHTGSRHKARR